MFRGNAHGVPASRLEVLRGVPPFRGYSDEQLARIDALTYETTLPAGSRLALQGAVRRQAFILLSGEATVEVAGEVVGRVTTGDLVGELSSREQLPQVATVTANTAVRVLVMDPREFGTWTSAPRVQGRRAHEVSPQDGDVGQLAPRRPSSGVGHPLELPT